MRRYLYEFIGTYLLVVTIGAVVLPGVTALHAAVAVGTVLVALVYMGKHACGAQYNPGVTLALVVLGNAMPRADILPYIIAQLAGAVVAAITAAHLFGPAAPLEITDAPRALLAEFIFSFALVWVILNVAVARGTRDNQYYGIAIGLVVMGAILAIGPITSAALNAAVALALAIMGRLDPHDIWIHITANLAAGAAAGALFKCAEPAHKASHNHA